LLLELLTLAVLKKYPLECGRSELFFFPFAVALISWGIARFTASGHLLVRAGAMALMAGIAALTLGWKVPSVSHQFYVGVHWENLNPSFQDLDKKLSSIVVYSDGTQVQVHAAPRLPSGFKFRYISPSTLASPSPESQEVMAGNFYYLFGSGTGDLQAMLGAAEGNVSHKGERIDAHLYLFRKKSDPVASDGREGPSGNHRLISWGGLGWLGSKKG
jgi:hypothetical protein